MRCEQVEDCIELTSDHYPVIGDFGFQPLERIYHPKMNNGNAMTHMNWNKIDVTKYQTVIEDQLRDRNYKLDCSNQIEQSIIEIQNVLTSAAALDVTDRKKRKQCVSLKRRDYGMKMSQMLQKNKKMPTGNGS